MELNQLALIYKEVFGLEHESAFFAPGRVNLIGEHIDYNGGLVFPCAISQGTYALVSKREDQLFSVYSTNFKDYGVVNFSLDDLSAKDSDNWWKYLKGILHVLTNRGLSFSHGLNIMITGTIPNGSGLSSSASLEVLMCKLCASIYGLDLSPVDMALIGKEVENHYIGVNSGIMDQFAIALGKAEAGLLLDCNTQKYEYIPLDLADNRIVIMNTNKRRELADSKYNERFSECMKALSLLKTHYSIEALCELSSSELPKINTILNDAILYNRVKHTITENERVIEATKVLEKGDLITFGKLLTASHVSLKEDYEVTGTELDTLVEAALEEGALGARMTGAGFGGCSIAIVPEKDIPTFIEKVSNRYEKVIGYAASFYIATANDGPKELN